MIANAYNATTILDKNLNVQEKNLLHKMQQLIQQYFLIASLLMLGFLALPAQAATVSVSNYPLFLLSQAVTEGAAPAKQLLQAGEVGHHGSISPGDIKAIQDSTFGLVW